MNGALELVAAIAVHDTFFEEWLQRLPFLKQLQGIRAGPLIVGDEAVIGFLEVFPVARDVSIREGMLVHAPSGNGQTVRSSPLFKLAE